MISTEVPAGETFFSCPGEHGAWRDSNFRTCTFCLGLPYEQYVRGPHCDMMKLCIGVAQDNSSCRRAGQHSRYLSAPHHDTDRRCGGIDAKMLCLFAVGPWPPFGARQADDDASPTKGKKKDPTPEKLVAIRSPKHKQPPKPLMNFRQVEGETEQPMLGVCIGSLLGGRSGYLNILGLVQGP